jgi:integrase
MASAGYRKRVSARTGRVSYQVWWLADDGSQGAKTVATKDEAVAEAARQRVALSRAGWHGRKRGRLAFSTWAAEWWQLWSADPDRSPTTLANAEGRLRLHLRPWFGDRPIERIGPADVRRWQAQLAGRVGHDTVVACRSLLLRIFQFATDEGAIETNPVRKVPPPKRRADPDKVFGGVKRRALTPQEAGRLLACFPLFWWDHVTCLLGTGLRFGELAGLRRRRVHLGRPVPVLQVIETRYQAGGRYGSGFKPQPKSDAGIRELPLAPVVVAAVRRQLPPGSDPKDLVFTGPGGGPGRRGGPGVPRGTRTVLSRHTFRRTHHGAVAKLADPTTGLRPTAARVLTVLRASGPLGPEQLAAHLAARGRAIRLATVDGALGELHAAGLATADSGDPAGRWLALPPRRDPLLDAVDLHGAHDFRHTFATWLEDAGIPARVIDEVMGHEASGRAGQQRGSAMGAHYRHTTPEMAARVAVAIQQRLTVVLQVAEQFLETRANRANLKVF